MAASPRLWRKALLGHVQLALAMTAAVLLSGGPRYVEGWVFLCVFQLCSLAITLHLLKHDPALLERRVKAGPSAEQRPRQKAAQLLASSAFIASMLLGGFDHRYGWSHAPRFCAILGNALVGLGFWAVFRVFRENTFASAVIELNPGQRVIDTGPYAWVRHPMYSGGIVLVVGIPLALGSLWGLLVLPPFICLLVWRLRDEEEFLLLELPGYRAYRERVRYRLVPGIW